MGLNNIVFNRNTSGLGQPLPGKDFISGFVFYNNTYPSGFSSVTPIKKLFSIQDALNLGINQTYSDETKATGGNVLIGTKGNGGDTDSVILDGVILGSVTCPTGGYATATAEATALIAAINANTNLHGIIASGSSGNVALALPAGWGKAACATGKLAFTSISSAGGTGGAAATIVQFSGGVGSFLNVMYYHIKEFFRLQPGGVLYVGIFPVPTPSFTGLEIQTMQNFANGDIRQIAVFLNSQGAATSFATSQVTALQSYANTLWGAHKPLSCLLGADFTGQSLGSLPDNSVLSSPRVSTILGQEGKYNMPNYVASNSYNIGDKIIWGGGCYKCNQAGSGNPVYNPQYWVNTMDNLRTQNGWSISNLGASLGAVALSAVDEDIAWVQKFNLSDGTNLDDIGFVTGDLLTNVSDNLQSTLNQEHYIFMRAITDVTGSYFNDSWTADAATDDYCYIEKNRTMDKAERGIYSSVIADLNGPLYVNADGTLDQATIAKFENDADLPLEQMKVAGEVSDYTVLIDPAQNVLSTSQLVISFQLLPVGVARNIVINDGFTTQIAS